MPLAHRVKRLLKDLRRRRVFRVSAAYLAVAFVLLQVAEIVFPALGFDLGLTISVIVAIVGFPVTVALVWIYDLTPMGVVRTAPMEDEEEAEDGEPSPALDARGVAVLPFEQVGGDEGDRYFCDGIHEDILTSLSKVADLRVVSRNSVLRYRSENPDPRMLGRDLGVGAVLEGSVRRFERQVRIAARLVDTRTGRNVWAETYDRSLDDIFTIQRDVAMHIVRALRAELSDEEEARIRSEPTSDLEAYDLYLRGRFLWNQRTERGLLGAIEPLRAAVDLDPDFALAHAGLADALLTQGLYNVEAPSVVMPRARAAAERALSLDPGLGEARAALGCVAALFDWNWEGARTDLEAATRLSPSYATARQWLAIHVQVPLGEFAAAHDALERARRLDPASPAITATEVFALYLGRRFEEAEDRARALIRDMPSFALAHQFLGEILLARGDASGALSALETANELRGRTLEVRAALAPVLAALGREADAESILATLEVEREKGYVAATRLARIEVALGRPESALDHLEAAVTERATDLVWAAFDPSLDPLRESARFRTLIGRMGLPNPVSPEEDAGLP